MSPHDKAESRRFQTTLRTQFPELSITAAVVALARDSFPADPQDGVAEVIKIAQTLKPEDLAA